MGEYKFKLPDIGEGVVEAEITAWHVKLGETVEEDQAVADVMTDKATIELTAPVDGVVKTMACEAGEMLAVGADLIVFTTEGGSIEDLPEPEPEKAPAKAPRPAADQVPEKPAVSKPVPANSNRKSAPVTQSKPSGKPSGKVLASPVVRRRAKEAGLDLSLAKPTGDGGHITQADLDLLEKVLTPIEGEERIKVIGLRRVIAERMQEAKRNIPHFTYVEEIDMTALEALRARANAKKPEERPKLTVLPFIIRAMAITFRDWPQFNARYMDEQGFVSRFSDLHLGIATQTDNGLIVPVLKHADRLSVWEISAEVARLAQGVRDNKLGKDDLSGATTTLTSLGPLGGIVTTPVINRPEVAIFGPNKIRPKLALENGEVVEHKVMNYSVSCDHRVIDGYDAAAMMQDMKKLLEDPMMMFLE